MHSIVGVSVSLNVMDAQASAWRAAGAVRLVRPNQLVPTVLLILGTAGVRREVGTNNHHDSFPPPLNPIAWAW